MAAAAAGTIGSLQLNHNLNYVFTSVDPTSLILSQFSHNNSHHPYNLHLSTQYHSFSMQRGSRYEEYASLRESKLRMKNMKQQSISLEREDEEFKLTSQKKQQFKSSVITQQQKRSSSSKGPSSVSVPEFVNVTPMKKEIHRRPAPVMERSPSTAIRSKSGTYDGIMGKMVGSTGRKSGEKKSGNGTGTTGGGFMARKSYASLEVLKGLGSQARRAINGESNGMRTPRRNCNLDRTEFAYSSQF